MRVPVQMVFLAHRSLKRGPVPRAGLSLHFEGTTFSSVSFLVRHLDTMLPSNAHRAMTWTSARTLLALTTMLRRFKDTKSPTRR